MAVSDTEALREMSEGGASAASFEDFYDEPAEDLLEQGEPRYGRRCVWVGPEGKIVEVDPDYVVSLSGNVYDPDKLDAVAGAVRGGIDAPWGGASGRPVLFVGYGTVSLIDEQDVRDNQEMFEAGETLQGRALDEDDIGKLLYRVRDGHHRIFGALLGGETRVWMQLYANQFEDVKKWRRGVKTSPDYDALMEILSKKLEED